MKLTALLAAVILISSCRKEDNENTALLYGRWRTSYSDTVEFFKKGNSAYIRYDKTLNPVNPTIAEEEYTFRNNKLGIKNGYDRPGAFHFFKTFSWIERGKSFQVQGVDWTLFISSTTTWFTFTKLP